MNANTAPTMLPWSDGAAPPAGGAAGEPLPDALAGPVVAARETDAVNEVAPEAWLEVTVPFLDALAVGPTALALTSDAEPEIVARLLTTLATGLVALEPPPVALAAPDAEALGWLTS
jgi:hypothetical protein